jgi:hypothetical protein
VFETVNFYRQRTRILETDAESTGCRPIGSEIPFVIGHDCDIGGEITVENESDIQNSPSGR